LGAPSSATLATRRAGTRTRTRGTATALRHNLIAGRKSLFVSGKNEVCKDSKNFGGHCHLAI
jgi:hypothetical protein